eukprot:CAMPEP_0172320020 /NCGR_PEP_ID=MMETSP1058-20130122/39417_1 /TAXON_ID=83371 /ORGANISM="Detonula confervacea, Strain CCMP 353" /LENGTH=104 /DNA_ID=CAMNT_0013035195 /DNA_START=125 /DNA_END=439 /DNA_ORIENTATION=+
MPNLRKLPSMFVLFLALPALVRGFSARRIQHVQAPKYHMAKKYRTFVPLAAGLDEDNNQVENSDDTQDNFDGKGLANYLGPYVAALGLSIAVTVAFVKFVLLDY